VRTRSAMLGLAAALLWTTSAFAQINQNDGPLVPPIQPEPTVGLPEQAPAESPAPDLPEPEPSVSAPAAASRPAARHETPEAAASSSAWQLECLESDAGGRVCQAVLRARVGEQVALVLALARDPADDAIRLQMALPLGIDIQRGATLTGR
jgi:invasion protein IalB